MLNYNHILFCFFLVRRRKKKSEPLSGQKTPGISILCNWVDLDVKLNKRSPGSGTNNCLDRVIYSDREHDIQCLMSVNSQRHRVFASPEGKVFVNQGD